jgi:hypothetical protein
MSKPPATALALLASALILPPAPLSAGPVICTTTLEAPPPALEPAADREPAGPVEVTRCAAVETTPALVQRRFFSYTAPFAQGVSITNQITDLLGIARGGGDGTRVMGFGFPDQTIVWDGTALENTYQVLMEQQSGLMPWRTADLHNGFSGSLGGGEEGAGPSRSPTPPVRGLW